MDSFSVLVRNLSFLGTRPDTTIFRYSPGFYHFRYSYGQFFGTRAESLFSGNTPVYYHFSILAQILPFSILIWTVFRYSHGMFLLRELDPILPFFDTRTDSTIFGTHMDSFSALARNLSFSGTRPGTTIFRYSHGFYHFRYSYGQFSGSRMESFFSGNSPGCYHFRYSYG